MGDRDIFPQEFLPSLGLSPELRDVFLAAHRDLLEPRFWQAMQEEQRAARVVDIFPYSADRRLVAHGDACVTAPPR